MATQASAKEAQPRVKRKPRKDSEKTRKAIISAARTHFADFGYEGAHVRKMLRGAGLNLALAHYHFESKEALYEAVIEDTLQIVLTNRRLRLAEWQLGDGNAGERITDLFCAYIQPHFERMNRDDGRTYALLMQQALANASKFNSPAIAEVLEVRAAYKAELVRLLPQLDPDRAEFVMDALVSMMLSSSLTPKEQRKKLDKAAEIAKLLTGGVVGIV